MKTDNIQIASGMSRAIKGVVAILGIAVTSVAFAAGPLGEVPVSLSLKELSATKGFVADSAAKRILPSKLYTYDVSGVCLGETGTGFGNIMGPKGKSLAGFLEFLKKGSSGRLRGTFSNASGTLDSPLKVINQKITGKKTIPGVGRFTISINISSTIDTTGKCSLKVSKLTFNPKLTPAQEKALGAIKFKKGSKLILSAAPEIAFLLPTKTNSEATGPVVIQVTRLKNFHKEVKVEYRTVSGTADTTDDYVDTHGTLVFADGEKSKNITVPLINNLVDDGARTFTVELFDPSSGAFIGTHPSIEVTIGDND